VITYLGNFRLAWDKRSSLLVRTVSRDVPGAPDKKRTYAIGKCLMIVLYSARLEQSSLQPSADVIPISNDLMHLRPWQCPFTLSMCVCTTTIQQYLCIEVPLLQLLLGGSCRCYFCRRKCKWKLTDCTPFKLLCLAPNYKARLKNIARDKRSSFSLAMMQKFPNIDTWLAFHCHQFYKTFWPCHLQFAPLSNCSYKQIQQLYHLSFFT